MKKRVVMAALALGMTAAFAQTKPTIDFWYALGGDLGKAVEAQVKNFNDSQDKVIVKAQYTGNYDDTLNKLRAALQAGKGFPNVVQVYDIGTRFLTDTGAAVSLQDLAERDKFDLSKFVGAPRNYYTVDGKMNSLPFNSSNPLLYINGDALQKAGVAYKPSWSLADLEAAVKKLTIKDASGKTTRYGLTISIDSWFVEQFSYNSGEYYCNNENGRKARATEVTFDNPAATAFVDFFGRMVREGYAAPVGRDGTASQAAFANAQAAMYIASTAGLPGTNRLIASKFALRTAYYPYLKERNGVAVGGASLWMLKGFSAEDQDAAWSFVKYLLEPKSQAKWHLETGYFPVIQGVTNLPEVRQAHVKNSNYTTTIKQLESSKVNTSSAGCLMGQFTEIRQYVAAAIEETIKGKPAAEALKDAKVKADAALERYNQSVK